MSHSLLHTLTQGIQCRVLRRSCLRACVLMLLTVTTGFITVSARQANETRQLESGKPVERELTGGEVHAYQIIPSADQYLRLVAEQKVIDITLTLLSQSGQKL